MDNRKASMGPGMLDRMTEEWLEPWCVLCVKVSPVRPLSPQEAKPSLVLKTPLRGGVRLPPFPVYVTEVKFMWLA